MLFTHATKRSLAIRRQRRDLTAAGYEEVADNGGKLWELDRGGRMGHTIVDVVIGNSGRTLFVKIEPPQPRTHE